MTPILLFTILITFQKRTRRFMPELSFEPCPIFLRMFPFSYDLLPIFKTCKFKQKLNFAYQFSFFKLFLLNFKIVEHEPSENWTLQIKFAQLRDSGIYECQVKKEKGMDFMYNSNNLFFNIFIKIRSRPSQKCLWDID